MRGPCRVSPMVALLLVAGACTDDIPTSQDRDLISAEAETFEVRIPFGDLADDVQVIGGFGAPWELNLGVVARDYPEGFEGKTLIRFGSYPTEVTVEDEDGETQADSDLTFVGGRVVLQVDTSVVRGNGPFTLSLAATDAPWDERSATWDHAVDTLGGQVPWEEPGGGPARELGQGEWDPAEGDSLVVEVDSATVAEWGDTLNVNRGLRVASASPGSRLRIRAAFLELDVEPSVNPDTVVTESAGVRDLTFIYTPRPETGDGVLQVGGVPSLRSVFRLSLPEAVDPPEALCQRIRCPLPLSSELVVFASLMLETRTSQPPGLQLADSLALEVRPVLEPGRLPRAPVGSPAQSRSVRLTPELFGGGGRESVEVPITVYIRDLLDARRDGEEFPTTLALLAASEPTPPGVATFAGSGPEGEPHLRLLITLSEGVQLP